MRIAKPKPPRRRTTRLQLRRLAVTLPESRLQTVNAVSGQSGLEPGAVLGQALKRGNQADILDAVEAILAAHEDRFLAILKRLQSQSRKEI